MPMKDKKATRRDCCSLFPQNCWQTTFNLIFHSIEKSFAQTTSFPLERYKKQAFQPQKSELAIQKSPFYTLISVVLQGQIGMMMKNSLENFSSKYLVDTSTQLSRKHKYLIFNRLEKLAKIAKNGPKALFLAKNGKKTPFFCQLFQQYGNSFILL